MNSEVVKKLVNIVAYDSNVTAIYMLSYTYPHQDAASV
jgi:hypothetical protein